MSNDTRNASQDSSEISREKLLERVRKLYAMSNQTEESPHEADIAMRRCEKLMSKYGIQESDLQTSEFDTTTFYQSRRVPRHVRYLAAAAAELLGVLTVDMRGSVEFRGYAIDATVAKLTFDYLVDAMERALRQRKNAGELSGGRRASADYRFAFAYAVHARVKAISKERERAEQSSSGSTSLVVRKMEQVRANCGEDVTYKKAKRYIRRMSEADAVGRSDGNKVSLNRQVQGGSSQPVLISK